MVTLAIRSPKELAELKGYSVQFESKIQTLNTDDCPITGIFKLFYEQNVFNVAKISDDYTGGQWKLDQGFWLLDSDQCFIVGNPNAMRNESLDAKSFSMFCSISALNILAWHYHNKGFSNLANLAIYGYHRAYTQLEFENDVKVDVIRSLLD